MAIILRRVFFLLWTITALSASIVVALETTHMSSKVQSIRQAFQVLFMDATDDKFNAGITFKRKVHGMKRDGIATKWASTLLDPIQVSKMELTIVSRTACPEINDYLDAVLQSALRSYKLDTGNFKWVTTANLSVALFLIGVCALYLVDSNLLSQSARNALGLVTLSIPFASVGTGLLAPKAYAAIDDQLCKLLNRDAFYQQEAEQRKRVIYHEAGHCLAGYLCGIPVVDYDISGEQDAGLSVLVELTTTKTQASDATISNTALDRSVAGGLLIVAVAGVVAETLYCGDSKGGRQDFPIAYEILRQFHSSDLSPDKYSTQTMEDAQDGYLRWALSKAFILLQLHEVALKAVAREMEKRSSMADCLAAIEIACLPSDRMDSS